MDKIKIGYIRVSKDIQDHERQVADLLKSGVAIDKIFADHGVSGARMVTKRHGFTQMLRFIESHQGEIEAVYVTELSRLGRNAFEIFTEIAKLLELGIDVISLNPAEATIMKIDPVFRPILTAAFTLAADLERKNTSERIKSSLRLKKSRGERIGRKPVPVDWNKVKDTMQRYNISEHCAFKILGYKHSTAYKYKKLLRNSPSCSHI